MTTSRSLPFRAAFSVLALPGVVAGFLPWWIQRGGERWPLAIGDWCWLGLVVGVPGLLIFASTVWEFFRRGRGTLAPWDPPRALVASGLFAYSRNPMYVGVVLLILGQGLWFRSGEVLAYGVAMFLIFHIRVIVNEEPWLAKSFPEPWAAYKSKVRRWGIF